MTYYGPGGFGRPHDIVNNPEHYASNSGNIQCIQAIEESMSDNEFKGYLKGAILKYIWRYTYKGKPLEDLQKAEYYLKKLIEKVGNNGSKA